jgi:hypothetical protein
MEFNRKGRPQLFGELQCQILPIEGVALSAQRFPTALNFGFLDRSPYFSLKLSLIYLHESEFTPFQTHYYSENSVAPGIEHGTSGSLTRNSDHKLTKEII